MTYLAPARSSVLPWPHLTLCTALLGIEACSPMPMPTPLDASSDAAVMMAIDALTDGPVVDQPTPDAAPVGDSSVPQPHCFDGMVEQVTEAETIIARTPHYELRLQGEAAVAVDYARTLEAAYPEWTAFFGQEPNMPDRLVVKVFRDANAFTAGLMADGLGAVGDAGGYFSPQTRTAYLYLQPTRYYSRVLLLHEATHQFHFVTRTANNLPFWYIEGIAEFLGRHDWDGRCVRLGVRPLLSQEDTPRTALGEVERGLSLSTIVGGQMTPSRPASQEAIRYLTTGDEGRMAPRFRAFRRAVDRGDAVATAFTGAFGAPASHDDAWRTFVQNDQEPMAPVFLEWTHVDSTTLLGNSPGVFSIARVKTPVTRFETTFQLPAGGSGSGGVLIAYQDPTHWEAVVVRSTGRLARFTVNGNAVWNDIAPAPAPQAGSYRFQAEYRAAQVTVTVNGQPFVRDITFPPIAGPAIDSAEMRFQSISWAP